MLDVAVHSVLNLKTWHRKVASMVFTKLLPFMLTTDPYCVSGSKQLEAGPAFLYEGFDHSPKVEVYRHPEIADKKILDKQWFEKQIYSSSKLVKQVEQACAHVHSLVVFRHKQLLTNTSCLQHKQPSTATCTHSPVTILLFSSACNARARREAWYDSGIKNRIAVAGGSILSTALVSPNRTIWAL